MAPPTFADQAPAIVHENLQHMVGERVRVVFYDDFTSEEKLNGRLGEVMGVASVEQCADAITAGTLVEVEVRLDEDAEHTEGEPNTRKFPPQMPHTRRAQARRSGRRDGHAGGCQRSPRGKFILTLV